MSYGHHPHGRPAPGPRSGMSTGAKFGIGCLGCFGLGVMGFFALLFLGALVSTTDDGGDTSVAAAPTGTDDEGGAGEAKDEGAEEAQPEETHPGLGETIEHGDWEIIVHAIEYDVPTAQLDEFFAEEPSGQWVTVELTVKNLGGEPRSFGERDQVLMDEAGSMYRYELWASTLFGFDTNPGSEETGVLAYDVPVDFEADHMLVNGQGGFTDGVRVDLD